MWQFIFALSFLLLNNYWEILVLLQSPLYSFASKIVSSSSDLFFLAPFYIAFFSKSSSHMCAWNYFLLSFPFSSLPKYFCPAIFSLQSPQVSQLLAFSVCAFYKKCLIFIDSQTFQVQTCMPSSWRQHNKFLGCPWIFFSCLWETFSAIAMWIFVPLSWTKFRRWFCLQNLKCGIHAQAGSVPLSGSLHNCSDVSTNDGTVIEKPYAIITVKVGYY